MLTSFPLISSQRLSRSVEDFYELLFCFVKGDNTLAMYYIYQIEALLCVKSDFTQELQSFCCVK